jgi:hypothetical protein
MFELYITGFVFFYLLSLYFYIVHKRETDIDGQPMDIDWVEELLVGFVMGLIWPMLVFIMTREIYQEYKKDK